MTYESLHSNSGGRRLVFCTGKNEGGRGMRCDAMRCDAMRALVLGGGLLAVMCVCLLKADLIYIYIHTYIHSSGPLYTSEKLQAPVLSMTPSPRAPTADNYILHSQPGKESRCLPQMRLTANRNVRRS